MRNSSKQDLSLSSFTYSALIIICLTLAACGGNEDKGTANIEAFLANAKNYQEKGQYQAAIIESRNAIQVSPGDERGHIILAEIFVEVGEPREAIKVLENLKGESADFVLSLAHTYYSAGKFRSAGELLDNNKTVLADYGLRENLIRAQIHLAKGEVEEARSLLAELLEADEGNITARMELARVAAAQGDFEEVETILEKVLQLEPDHAEALLLSSAVYTSSGDLSHAEEMLMKAVSSVTGSDIITPLRYSVLASLRDNLTQQGKTSEALIYSGLLAESTPGAKEAAQKLQDVMDAVSSSDFEDARQLLNEIREKAPNSERAGTLLGVVEYLQGDNDAAIRQFEQFVDPEVASPVAMQLFAMAELKLNQPEKVLSRLKDDIDDSKDGKLVALYGIAAISAGDAAKGEKYLLKAFELDPENGRLRLPLAKLYNIQNKREEALREMQAAFKTQPSDPTVQGAYLEQLSAMEQLQKAAKIVKDLRASFPESLETQLVIANHFLGQQKYDEAKKSLRNALRMGDSKPARYQLARINLVQKEYGKAETSYRDLIKADAEDSDAYKGLITVYELRDETSLGIEEVNRLLEQNKAEAPRLVLSEYYGRNGQFDQAFALVNRSQEPNTPKAAQLIQTLFVAKANQLLGQGEFDESRKTILQGLTEAADNPRLLALLVSVELGADKVAEAEKVFAQLQELIAEAPIITILAGDIAFSKKDFNGALEQYRLVWNQAPSDQIAVKIYRAMRELPGKGDSDVIGFMQEWGEKIPQSRLSGLTLGGHYMEAGSMDSAKHVYEDLLKNHPDTTVAHNNLAWIYGEKDLRNALASGKRAFELAPESAEIIDTYAWFLYKSGDLGQARTLLAKAVDLAPDNQDILEHFNEVSTE